MRAYLNDELKRRQDDYTDTDAVNLFVGTWNLNGVKPYESVDISAWIFPIDESFIPDIVVVGLQEIVEVKASTLLGGGNVDFARLRGGWQQVWSTRGCRLACAAREERPGHVGLGCLGA